MKKRDRDLHDTLQFQSITRKKFGPRFSDLWETFDQKKGTEMKKYGKKLYYMGNTFLNLGIYYTYVRNTHTRTILLS